ncbi:MAG: radical SAM family heme chaperone HemW [Steroidobacteraceae bacterium]
MIDPSLALYVHMPWCVRKCPYCDFNSHELKEAAPDASYVDALIRDLDTQLPQVAQRRIDTVFFGGGTPSLFEPEHFSRLLGALRQRIAVAHDVEVTLEANPGTIERGQFAGYRDAGINRVSLGAQTFSARALEVLGRIHSPQDTESAVAELRAAKLENFNLDLMYALPGQTEDEALEDVRTACALEPSHISYYQLTLEPGTVFHARPPALPDEDAAWQMQSAGQRLLAEAGYAQYEVSAYAREGLRCRHNLNYWRFGDYLGIGAGAHGKISVSLPDQILRTSKPRQPRTYQRLLGPAQPAAARAVPIGESSCIAPRDLPFEYMLNALRLNEGFTARGYRQRTGLAMDSVSAKLTEAQARGLLEEAGQGWRPTRLGLRFLNDLQSSFLA